MIITALNVARNGKAGKNERLLGGESDYSSVCWRWDAYGLKWKEKCMYISGWLFFSKRQLGNIETMHKT